MGFPIDRCPCRCPCWTPNKDTQQGIRGPGVSLEDGEVANCVWKGHREPIRRNYSQHKMHSIAWAKWVLQRQRAILDRWVYTGGTVLYFARTKTEQASKVRAALGGKAWRMTDGADGLYEDCAGPSAH